MISRYGALMTSSRYTHLWKQWYHFITVWKNWRRSFLHRLHHTTRMCKWVNFSCTNWKQYDWIIIDADFFFLDPTAIIVIFLRSLLPTNSNLKTFQIQLLFKYNCYVNGQIGSQQIRYGAMISIQFMERNENI